MCRLGGGDGAGLEGVQQVPGLADGVLFQELPQDVGQDAAALVAVYCEASCSGGGLLPVSRLRFWRLWSLSLSTFAFSVRSCF